MNKIDSVITYFKTFENKLISLNDNLVLLDKDVAALYKIEPKKLRQQLKRNIEKFPKDYAFQLADEEVEFMVSQNVTPSKKQFGGTNPWVFNLLCDADHYTDVIAVE